MAVYSMRSPAVLLVVVALMCVGTHLATATPTTPCQPWVDLTDEREARQPSSSCMCCMTLHGRAGSAGTRRYARLRLKLQAAEGCSDNKLSAPRVGSRVPCRLLAQSDVADLVHKPAVLHAIHKHALCLRTCPCMGKVVLQVASMVLCCKQREQYAVHRAVHSVPSACRCTCTRVFPSVVAGSTASHSSHTLDVCPCLTTGNVLFDWAPGTGLQSSSTAVHSCHTLDVCLS